jgi:hypothetical protein
MMIIVSCQESWSKPHAYIECGKGELAKANLVKDVKIPISSLVIVGNNIQCLTPPPCLTREHKVENTAIIIHTVFLEPAKRQCSAKCSNWLKAKLVPLEGGVRGGAEIGYYQPPSPTPTPEIESESWSSCCCENKQSTKLESGLFEKTKDKIQRTTAQQFSFTVGWNEKKWIVVTDCGMGPVPPPRD